MRKLNKVAIIGVGLIGGSIGLSIKKRGLARQVVGVFRHRSTMNRALRYKAIDKGFMDIAEAVKGADLVVLASPVQSIPALAARAAKSLGRGAIITDAGSTKVWIVDKVERALKGSPVRFVGSHPMAGSEKTGVEFARADLLKGSPCIVTRTARTSARALSKVKEFWKGLGAVVKLMSPAEHDRRVSLISHLPHIAAYSLAGAVPPDTLDCAAEGFKDTTRVASSDPVLWSDIFLTNRREILKAAKLFGAYYKRVVSAIERGDRRLILKALSAAKTKRDALSAK